MARGALRLHHRMVIPVALVAVVTTSAAVLIALAQVRRALEARVVAQLLNAASVVSRSDFPLNESILDRVKDIAGTDVVTYTLDRTVIATTIDRRTNPGLIDMIVADRSIAGAPEDRTVLVHGTCGDAPCFIAYRHVTARPRTIVALVQRTSEVAAVTQAVARTTLIAAGVGLFVLVLVGQVVARRVTRPLDRLVAFTRNVSPEGERRRAAVGDDEIGTLAGAFNDMLDRLDRAQEALLRSEKLAVAGLLAARVAHDIRNPLSSIKMQAQLLRSRVSGDEAQTMLQAVIHDVDQVESVIQGLLELARPGDVALTPQSLNDVIRQVLDHLALQMQHRKIAVLPNLAPDLAPLPLDADRFRQALLNVIANAADAMPGGGTLSVSTRASADGSTVTLEVCDDGVGVDPAVLAHVFDPFVSTKREGVGLGLVNTKAIVERHGGRVALTPRSPRGTCVTITLPAASTDARSGAPVLHG